MPIILKNTTASKLEFSFGDSIAGLTAEDFDHLNIKKLATSQDLIDAINQGHIVVNDGTDDLVPSDAIAFLQGRFLRMSKVISDGVVSKDTQGNSLLETDTETGEVKIKGLTFPDSDGTAQQVLTTDGSGNLVFLDVSTVSNNTLAGLADTNLTDLANEQILVYDNEEWKNKNRFPYHKYAERLLYCL